MHMKPLPTVSQSRKSIPNLKSVVLIAIKGTGTGPEKKDNKDNQEKQTEEIMGIWKQGNKERHSHSRLSAESGSTDL